MRHISPRPFRLAAAASFALCALAFGAGAAQARVHIDVNLDTQTMHVEANGKSFDWKVSSGKPGYETPNGSYHVLWMDKDHFSDTYDQAPMPNAIFFAPGYAIHGAYKSPWGHQASHGCVRLPPAKAAVLFDMVKAQGADITLTGGAEASTQVAEKLKAGKSGDTGVVKDASAPIYEDPGAAGDTYAPPPADVTAHDTLFGQVY